MDNTFIFAAILLVYIHRRLRSVKPHIFGIIAYRWRQEFPFCWLVMWPTFPPRLESCLCIVVKSAWISLITCFIYSLGEFYLSMKNRVIIIHLSHTDIKAHNWYWDELNTEHDLSLTSFKLLTCDLHFSWTTLHCKLQIEITRQVPVRHV